MGRAVDRFQKRKEREREVRKKILSKRAISRADAKEDRKKFLLEKENSKKKPIRRNDPSVQQVLDMTAEAFKEKDPNVDSSTDTVPGPTSSAVPRGQPKDTALLDDAIYIYGRRMPQVDAKDVDLVPPKYSGEATLEPL